MESASTTLTAASCPLLETVTVYSSVLLAPATLATDFVAEMTGAYTSIAKVATVGKKMSPLVLKAMSALVALGGTSPSASTMSASNPKVLVKDGFRVVTLVPKLEIVLLKKLFDGFVASVSK